MTEKKKDWESIIMGLVGICAGVALLVWAAGFAAVTILMIRDLW